MEEMQNKLQEWISKAFDEKLGPVAADVKQMAAEIHNLRGQVDDFGKDLDAVKQAQAPAPHPRDHRPQPQVGGAAVFANKGPPPMPTQPHPEEEPDDLRGAGAGEWVDLDCERRDRDDIRERHDGYRLKPPKHPFPAFKGEFPLLWIDNCYTYFEMYNVPARHWISTATLYFEDHAALWLQAYKRTHHQIIWSSFITAVVAEFGCDEYDGQMSVLLQLRQTGTVAEYKRSFESCMYHLLSVDSSLNSKWFISHFVHGLRDDLRAAVRLQGPTSVTWASSLARIQEEEYQRPRARPPAPTKHPTAAAAIAAPGASAVVRTEGARRVGDDYTRERQLRDFRRTNGLCFRCGDKYSKDHKCKQPAQVLMIHLGDFGEVLSEDTIHAVELLDEPAPDASCCSLSNHALAGTEELNTLRLRAMFGNKVMLILIDSGSTTSFVNSEFVQRAQLPVQNAPRIAVGIADGSRMYSNTYVQNLTWWCQGTTFSNDMRVLDLGAYDAVLGMDWLASFSPMHCHWRNKHISFTHGSKEVQLQGLLTTQQKQLQVMEFAELQKCLAGNDVWALAVIEQSSVEQLEVSNAAEIQNLLTEFDDVFQDPKTLPPHRAFDHAITLDASAQPVNSRPYRYSPLQKDEIERQVKEMLDAGLIAPSLSPFASPVLLVKKKDNTWRFCVDYRKLNESTVKNKFPLPIADELLDELAGTKYFSKLDLRAGYHQIRMLEKDEPKTAFKTHHGHFQFRVMPFGLTNAPGTFQCLMNSIFALYTRKFVIVFLDDILVYSPDLATHLKHLRLVLSTLREHQLYAKVSKCSFAKDNMDYLGHIISHKGVATDPEKTAVMKQWPLPTNATELRGFLGLTGYYRKFVKNYGIIAKPLTNLLTKKGFIWTEQATVAFNLLKNAMANTPVLTLPNFTLPFVVETDACDTGVGAVLMQQGHPVAYMSKALGVKNSKLSIYEKEFMAVIMAIDKWRSYLQRGPFTILTDHQSLCSLTDQHLTTELQKKAMSKLLGLQFSIKYRKGSENNAADSLSRVGHLLQLNALSICQPAWAQEILTSYDMDPEATGLLAQLAVKSPDSRGYSLDKGLIRYNGRLYIGNQLALQTKLISALHESPVGGHSGIHATYQRVRKVFFWPGIKMAVEDFVKQCPTCQKSKNEHCQPAGKLQPLPVPTKPWNDITMDFIEGLPLSDGMNVILVVVDRLTKYAHFIPLRHPYTAASVSKLFLDQVVKLHGVPETIVSDRDPIFTSNFWRALIQAVGPKLNYSTANHPSTDGQTERVNQCLEQYLRCAVHACPSKWRQWLPMAEFWYNSSYHSSIKCSPFKALYGMEPNFGALPNLNVDASSAAYDVAAERQKFTEMLKENLVKAQTRMKSYADQNRTERSFSVGDDVLLKLQPYSQSSVANRPYPKLAFKFFGPFKVLAKIGEVAYKLELPEGSAIHPVFHVSQLKPFLAKFTPVFTTIPAPDTLQASAPQPEAILDRRMVKKGNAATVQILVQWSSLPVDCATWEDYYVLKTRFPMAPIWDQPAFQGGAIVTPPPTDKAVYDKEGNDTDDGLEDVGE